MFMHPILILVACAVASASPLAQIGLELANCSSYKDCCSNPLKFLCDKTAVCECVENDPNPCYTKECGAEGCCRRKSTVTDDKSSPTPPPPVPPSNATLFCPEKDDWELGGDDIAWDSNARGWTVTGSGGVHGKATYNLLGGYVEFTMDTSHATAATNTNFYTSSPTTCCSYCDIQPNKSPQCVEMDIIENNGNCAMATTWHTCANKDNGVTPRPNLQCGSSSGDCNEAGCAGHEKLPGGAFQIRADFSMDGDMTVALDGKTVSVNVPIMGSSQPREQVVRTMTSLGAMFHSTQWQGWAPSGSSCPTGGDLGSSRFSVFNVTILGSVVQGAPPTKC